MLVISQGTLAGRRIGVFGKGGSGKSTLVVLLARELARRRYDVCVLDADSTNEGMPQALGVTSAPRPLIEHFGGMVFRGGAVTCPVDDPTRLRGARVSPRTLPAEYWGETPDGVRLLTVGKMGGLGPGAGCDGPLAKIARDLRIHLGDREPVTVVDFKAGFEDSARGVITGLDWILVVVDPTTAAIRMAVDMRDTVRTLADGGQPATAHLESPELADVARAIYREAELGGVLVVLNRVADDAMEESLIALLRREGIEPVGAIRDDDLLRHAWLRDAPIESLRAQEAVAGIAGRLEAAAAAGRGAHRGAPA
jgi:CO dehydrogenase nickel-insertion accessory protein CooC1